MVLRGGILGLLVVTAVLALGYVVLDVRMLRSRSQQRGRHPQGFLAERAYGTVNPEWRQWQEEKSMENSNMVLGRSELRPLTSCNFEATLSLSKVVARIQSKWGVNSTAAEGIGQQIVANFQSLCLNRFDLYDRRTVTINYAVLVPPGYTASNLTGGDGVTVDRPIMDFLPTIYLLHARDGAFTKAFGNAVRPNVADVAVDFAMGIRTGSLPPAIVVLPFSKPCSLWADYVASESQLQLKNPMHAQSESNLLAVVADVDQRFRTIAGPHARALVGDSMGGEAAVRLTLKYRVGHGVFGAALATDPGVFSWASLQSRGTAGYETSGYTGATQKSDDAAACKFEQRYYLSNVFAEDAALFEQFSYAQYLDQDGDSVLSHIDVRIRFVAGKDDKRHAEAVSQLGRDLCSAGISHEEVWVPNCGHDQGCILTTQVVSDNFAFLGQFFKGHPLDSSTSCTSSYSTTTSGDS